MDVSFTNVLEGARQYFQGLPAPSTTPEASAASRIYDDHQRPQQPPPAPPPPPPVSQSSTETRFSNDALKVESTSSSSSSTSNQIPESYWSTHGDLRTIEPFPPQPTRVEVPDTRPEETIERNGSLTEMQPAKKQPDPAKSPPPVYQQLNNVSRPSSYRSTTDMLTYQSTDRPLSAPRTQYYPRYHHPDITKSAPVPFSQNSIYQAPTPQATTTPAQAPPRASPVEVPSRQAPEQSSYQPPNSNYQGYRPPGGSRPPDPPPSHPHIPSPQSSHPGHIPSPHLPVASVLATSRPSQYPRVSGPAYSTPNQHMLPPPPSPNYTSHEHIRSASSSPAQQQQHAPSPHNFQPHSPTYPPPPMPQSYVALPPTSQQQRVAYQQAYPPSSYHSYQKPAGTYPQTSRSYAQPIPPSSQAPSEVTYTQSKVMFNGVEPKAPVASQPSTYPTYRMPAPRNSNTHNLPVTAVTAYPRNSRESSKAQPLQPRQRTPMNSINVPTIPVVPRPPEFNSVPAVSERLPVTVTSSSVNYSYANQQYRGYATTVAPSHHGSSASTTSAVSIADTRPSVVHPSSGIPYRNPSVYSNYKDYPHYVNQPQVPQVPHVPQSNGLPLRKRESPLDLSVKTVKTSADSTARDDFEMSGDKQVSSSSVRRSMAPPVPNYAPFERNGRNSVPTLRPATPQMPVCAPKVDFLPDFNSGPLRHPQPNHDSHHRNTSQQLYAPSQQLPATPLPHMSTFKKSSLPVFDHKSPYPVPQMRYTVEPVRPTAPTEYPPEVSKYYPDTRPKYLPKRPGDPLFMASGSGPSKQPRLEWKLAIDKEIQNRLNAAQALREQQKKQEAAQANKANGSVITPTYPPRPADTSRNYPTTYCDNKRPYVETKVPYSHPLTKPSISQPSTAYPPNFRPPYGGQEMNNAGADKRAVLSLLRNSLENKQQREEQMNSQQPILVNHSQQSFQNKVVAPVEPKTNIGRHNLSPFTAASLLERNSNTPPHYKFHMPRAVDSITQDNPRSLYGSRVNASATLPAGKEALLVPRDDNQIYRDKDDSLAAILAAKIRTKAELKQVGTGQLTSKPVQIPAPDANDIERAASTSTPSSAGSPPKLTREKTPCLPPRRRLFSRSEEDNLPVAATVPTPAAIVPADSVVSARTCGFRSSSEASVFDFRDSDSEGEMPVLERQTLEEMRRDRKQLSKVQPPVPLNDAMCMTSTDLVKIELKENDKITELDPFWTATCDKFMEQLRNGDVKKRGRRKKIGEGEDSSSRVPEIKPEDIKKEVIEEETTKNGPERDADETEMKKKEPEESKPLKKEPEEEKESDEDSDAQPLIKRAPKKKKIEESDDDDDDDIIPKKRTMRRGSRIKLVSTSESSSSSENSDTDEFGGTSVAHRLRNRKRSSTTEAEGMKLRSRETPVKKEEKPVSKSPNKANVVPKPKPKPLFGDGSDFRPGWEEEVYVYKKSLRMPPRLINVSKPSRFHRLSTSLPDLDPGSPALSVSMDSTDVCLRKRTNDSDDESICSAALSSSKIDDEEATSSTTKSIVDLLAKKVGGTKKDAKKKTTTDKKPGTKTLPKGSNEPELLPTPSLTPLLVNETTKTKTPTKNNVKKPVDLTESYLLGYFRKETVNNFRDTFKNNHALPNEFSTFVLKTRTRTETRVLKKQATIREVFGEDRPASAPPMQNHAGDTSQEDDDDSKEGLTERTKSLKQKVVSRLRNVGILRSHKAVMNSKRHLLTVQRRKDLLKTLAEKKLKEIKKEPTEGEEEEEDEEEEEEEETASEVPGKKKLRTARRKFRSGFDYIRKKKKPLKKEEGGGAAVAKERKRPAVTRPNAECVADIQNEIRTWVIKKGVGETVLHRAARLGYTDVAAYCLEKLNNPPSPRDNAGYTPLHEACSRGHLEIAKLLLAYGANASESANGGIRPLHEAAENGATELVRLLLSYGADPLLATYSGQTPLMLAVDTDAYAIIEQHLDDVQGRSSVPWTFGGPSTVFDPDETGFDPLIDAPSFTLEPEPDEFEVEMSDICLPVLFTLHNDPDKWVLLQDLMNAAKVKSRDALLRQINPKASSGPPSVAHREVMRELKLPDFLEQSRCCHLLSAGEKINVRASKVTLIKYTDKVKALLNVERIVINLR